MFVLVGQILNARGRFGPMMWAPIANNLIAIAVLVTYLFVVRSGPAASELAGPFTPGQEALLGLGSTLGIVVAAARCWCPTCAGPASATGPGSTCAAPASATRCGSGVWTVLFVIVNQIAYTVVVNLAEQRPGAGARASRRHRLHRLLLRVPDRDGPPLDHHRLAGDRGAAAALAARRRRRPAPSSPAR